MTKDFVNLEMSVENNTSILPVKSKTVISNVGEDIPNHARIKKDAVSLLNIFVLISMILLVMMMLSLQISKQTLKILNMRMKESFQK